MVEIKERQNSTAEVPFDPSLYPRTYSASIRSAFWLAVLFAIELGVTILLWRLHVLTSDPRALFLLLLTVFLGYVLLGSLTCRVILEPEAVTVRYAFSTRSLQRYEIAGWRATSPGKGAETTARTLVPRDDTQKSIAFPQMNADAAFSSWFVGIPEIKPADIMDTPPKGSNLTTFLTFVGLMIGLMAAFGLLLFLDGRPFQLQVFSTFADTEFVFFFVFCDSRAWHGYSLHNRHVRRELPRLVRIHCLSLVLIFAFLTFALSARPHLPSLWLVGNGPRAVSFFASALMLFGIVTVMAQAMMYRKILRRALEGADALPPDKSGFRNVAISLAPMVECHKSVIEACSKWDTTVQL